MGGEGRWASVNPRAVLLVAASVSIVVLVGCIGGEVDDPAGTEDPAETFPGTPSQAYIPGGDDGLREIDPEEVLPEGVPAPTGLSRYVDHERQGVFEPTLGVTSDGTLFISNMGGSLGDHSSVLRSVDQGQTWEDVTGSLGPVSSPPTTFDPYVYVDEDTDRVYNLDMMGLQGNWIRWSDDGGDTWMSRPQAGETPVLDHPTIFSGPPKLAQTAAYENVLYLCANRIADSACATSLDGGLTWTPFKTVYPGVNEDVVEGNGEGECGGLHAHGTVGPEGTAYLPKGQCNVPSVAVSQDDGLTWEIHEITTEVPIVGHEVAIATDDEGTLFAHWDSAHRPVLAFSTDQGQTWSDPIDLSPPNVTHIEFPTIAAAGEGNVALAYVGTTHDIEHGRRNATVNTTWNGYITTITDATSEQPAVMTLTANDPADPIARGECHLGNRCDPGSGGAMGDFIDIVIDDDGRPWAGFVDACTRECIEDPSVGKDHGVGFVGTFNQGPSLTDPTQALEPLVEAE